MALWAVSNRFLLWERTHRVRETDCGPSADTEWYEEWATSCIRWPGATLYVCMCGKRRVWDGCVVLGGGCDGTQTARHCKGHFHELFWACAQMLYCTAIFQVTGSFQLTHHGLPSAVHWREAPWDWEGYSRTGI